MADATRSCRTVWFIVVSPLRMEPMRCIPGCRLPTAPHTESGAPECVLHSPCASDGRPNPVPDFADSTLVVFFSRFSGIDPMPATAYLTWRAIEGGQVSELAVLVGFLYT